MKKESLTTLLLILFSFSLRAQVVTTDPQVPVTNQPVTIYFDATQGTGGLKDYTGDVYAHTGVITEYSSSGSDWKYVKTNWGENTPETKMTRISGNLYKLDIGPDIRSYYQVPQTEEIKEMAFVFRSDFPYSGSTYYEGKETGGQDIFVETFEPGLNVTFSAPVKPYVVLTLHDSLPVTVSATLADSVSLYVNNTFIKYGTDSTTLTDTLYAESYGEYWVKTVARNGAEAVADSFFLVVRQDPLVEELPAGMQDGINYTSDTSVVFVLYAPYKNHVFLMGDITGWRPRLQGLMNITPDNQRYWITISHLTPGEEYRYQYLIDDTLLIADPYTEKILDPANDPYIPGTTYPGLNTYPTDSTTGIVSVISPGRAAYSWHNNNFTPPEKQNLVIYELLIRDFVARHDYKTLTDTLDYFQRLGINAIELMPVNEFEGNESWGYNPSFYFAPDKYYGPAKDLKVFIDSCHAKGIAVILDMVLNHSYGQSPLVQMYFDPSTGKVTPQNPWYNITSPNPTYSWGYDFNHESPATKAFVDRVTRFWLENYHVDGYRFDFTKGFTNTPGDGWDKDDSRIAILERMADSIHTYKPNAFLILEHFTDNTEEKILSDYGFLLWGNSNCNFSQAAMGYASGPCGTWDYSWGVYSNRGWTQPNLVTYMESHDEERLMYKNLTYGNSAGDYSVQNLTVALQRVALSSVLFLTIPGPKMIWQFGELGYDVSIEDPCRVCNKPIHWDYYNETWRLRLYQTIASLVKLKKEQPVFATQDFDVSASGSIKYNVLRDASMDLVAIGNFDVTTQTANILFPVTGTWYEYFSGDSLDITSTTKTLSLDPGNYRIYTTQRLALPNITASTPLPDKYPSLSKVTVYPNPSHGMVTLQLSTLRNQNISLSLIDPLGKIVLKKNYYATTGNNTWLINLRDSKGIRMHTGIYFLRIEEAQEVIVKKIMVK